jgi:hypothetical protein
MNPRNNPPTLTDQDDNDLLAAGGVSHPRPGHLTEYERRDRNRRRLGDWLLVAVLAAAMAICLFLYNLPNILGWLEAGL